MKERAPSKNERELLDFARVYLAEAFPNPERAGCPPDDALKLLAKQPMDENQAVGEHVTLCSPCFKAYMAHLDLASAKAIQRQTIRYVFWMRGSAALLAAASVLIIAVYSFIDKRHSQLTSRNIPASVASTGNTAQIDVGSDVPLLIDLSTASPIRGAEQSADSAGIQIIPSRSPVTLSVRLPFASEETWYSIRVSSARNIVWSSSARAFRRNGDTLLTLHADFTHVHAGKYELQVASADRRLTIPILITKESPKKAEPKQ